MHVDYYNQLLLAVGSEDLSNRKGYDYAIKFYDLTTGKIMKRLEGHKSWIECLVNLNLIKSSGWLPKKGQRYIASGSDDTQIKVWCMDNFSCFITLIGHSSYIFCLVQFSEVSQEILISGSQDKTIKIWNFIKGSCLKTLRGHEGFVNSIVNLNLRINSKKHEFASCSDDSQIRIWDFDETTMESQCTDILVGHKGRINRLLSIKTIKLDIIVSCGFDGLIKIWDLCNKSDLKCICNLKGHTEEVLCIERLLNHNYDCYLTSGGKDKDIRIWSINKEECIETINMGLIIFSIMSFNSVFEGNIAVGVEHSIHIVNVINKIIPKESIKVAKPIDLSSYSSNDK